VNLSHEMLALTIIPALAVVARVVIVLSALRGTKPAERPAILRALAGLFGFNMGGARSDEFRRES
jgi:hypothetical protein